MVVDLNTGTVITLTEAQDLVSEFGKQYPAEVKSFFVGANKINSILAQEECIGLRVYNGYDYAESRMSDVFIGVDLDGNDMKTGVIVDRSAVCPPICPTIGLMD
jgi:hypothetical protein